MLYAHSLEGRPRSEWETLEAHALRVAMAAQIRASVFGGGDYARLLGMLHDLGKVKLAFQRKLQGERNEASHSGEGARVLFGADSFSGALAGIIAGHHGRLPDPDRLRARIARAEEVSLARLVSRPSA